jgi:hypothetical protein
VDPGQAGAALDDPQSWNAYGYARNNPLRFIDPTGLTYVMHADGGEPVEFSDAEFERMLDQQPFRDEGILLVPSPNPFGLLPHGLIMQHGLMIGRWWQESVDPRPLPTDETLFNDLNSRIGNSANEIVVAGGILWGVPFVWTLLPTAGTSLGLNITTNQFGQIIGWGTGQTGAAVTQGLTQTLTGQMVRGMIARGLTQHAVRQQPMIYQRALTNVAMRANANLQPRIELLNRILALWPWW